MTRTKVISEYLFAEIDQKLAKLKAQGVDVISFGVGDPDSPPPTEMREKLVEFIADESMHNYSPYEGMEEFRKSAARYIKRKYNTVIDPVNEVVGLIGSKEGIANTYIAYTEENDVNIVPSLAYPIPKTATLLAGGKPYVIPVLSENGFIPKLDDIPTNILQKTKLFYLNYPNNPTGIGVEREFFEKVLYLSEKYDFTIVFDAAYEELKYDNSISSFYQIKDARKHVLEFHSLSKMFNITGWRLAFVVGDAALLKPLRIMKTNMDSGQFKPLQLTGAWALDNLIDKFGEIQRKTYGTRLNKLKSALEKLGCNISMPSGTFFLWGKTPNGMDSIEFTEFLLEKYAIFVTPGNMFGKEGEGFFRASLTVTDKRLEEALLRLQAK